VLDLPAREKLRNDRLDGIGGDREADSDVAGRLATRLDLRVDSDDLAVLVDQRATGVALVDRRIGLDDLVDRESVGGAHRALQRADDARCHRPLEPKRVADRDHGIADYDLGRVGERKGVKRGCGGIDLEERDVTRGIRSDEGRVDRLAGGEVHLDRVGAFDDVVVRDDVTRVVDDEA